MIDEKERERERERERECVFAFWDLIYWEVNITKGDEAFSLSSIITFCSMRTHSFRTERSTKFKGNFLQCEIIRGDFGIANKT